MVKQFKQFGLHLKLILSLAPRWSTAVYQDQAWLTQGMGGDYSGNSVTGAWTAWLFLGSPA